jgi:hypothetical protein
MATNEMQNGCESSIEAVLTSNQKRRRAYSYSQIASWGFGDAIFGTTYDNVTSTIKLRRAGFPDCIDTEEMFCTLFDQLRLKRIIP